MALILLSSCGVSRPATVRDGGLASYPAFPSRYVKPRQVDILLPPGYDARKGERYPVLYMHDGQNLFLPGHAFGGDAWKVDSVLARLQAEGIVPPCIVVGVWNTDKRYAEYLPAEPYAMLPAGLREQIGKFAGGPPLSDNYLRFLVEELIPFVDKTYRTRAEASQRFLAGSSMGGLISLYGICRYPEVFGAAACLSTHWPLAFNNDTPELGNTYIRYFGSHLPDPATHRLYFDYGTATLDSLYEPYQLRMDAEMTARGFRRPANWQTRKFPGAEHSERSWRERLAIPLTFLLGKN